MTKLAHIIFLNVLLVLVAFSACSLPWQSSLHVLGRVDSLALEITFSPDSQLVAAGTLNDGAKVWRISDKSLVYTLGSGRVNDVVFSPDNELIVTGGGGDNSTVTIWRRSDGTLVRELDPTLTPWVQTLAIAPDGATLAVGTNDNVHLFNVQDGALIRTFEVSGLSVAYSPNSEFLAIAENLPVVQIWRISTQQVVHALAGHGFSLAYSPNGELLASPGWNNQGMITFQGAEAMPTTAAGGEETVQLWNTQDGSPHSALTGHAGQIHGIAFSPDGQFVVSAANDNTVRLWRVGDGVEISKINTQQNPDSVAFAGDNSNIAIAVGDTVYFWPIAELIREQ